MTMKSVFTIVLLLVAVAGIVTVFWQGGDETNATEGTEAALAEGALPTDGVVVYYFHGHKRCMTCNKMEALADEAVWADHRALVDQGRVLFQAVNIETDEHRHFVEDYELVNKVIVLSERRDGQEVSYTRLDEVWDRIGDDADYRAYISEGVTTSLEKLGLEAG